jgi:hypothetical protein
MSFSVAKPLFLQIRAQRYKKKWNKQIKTAYKSKKNSFAVF